MAFCRTVNFWLLLLAPVTFAQERGDDTRICRYGCRQHNLFGLWYLWFMIVLMVLTVLVMARMCCFYMKVKKARLTGPHPEQPGMVAAHMPYPYNQSTIPPVAFIQPPPQYSDVVGQDHHQTPMYAAAHKPSTSDRPKTAEEMARESQEFHFSEPQRQDGAGYFGRQENAFERSTTSQKSPPHSGRLPPLPPITSTSQFDINDAERGSVESIDGSSPRERLDSVSLNSPGLPEAKRAQDGVEDPENGRKTPEFQEENPAHNEPSNEAEGYEAQKKTVSFSGFFDDETRKMSTEVNDDENPELHDRGQDSSDVVEAADFPKPENQDIEAEPELPVVEATEVPLGPRPGTSDMPGQIGSETKYDMEALMTNAKTDPEKTEERVYEVVSLPPLETNTKDEKDDEF